jgi:divinyl protochlorophyllide a 8-vinyl-reductase
MLDDACIARVGPNALIQMDRVLTDRLGERLTNRIFAAAGVARGGPGGMVPETDVRQLFDALAAARPRDWPALAHEAGERTADYLLAHRIPRAARIALRLMPAWIAGRLLARAIARHAWTFAGSGTFVVSFGRRLTLAIEGNTLAMPDCPWHSGVFDRLFHRLVGPHVGVLLTDCCARGARACIFEIEI